MISTPLTEMLGIRYPVIQAGMGPWNTDRLCIAAANAGALGIISTVGIGYFWTRPEEGTARTPYDFLRAIIARVAEETAERRGVFGANIPLAMEFKEQVQGLIRAVADARGEDADVAARLKVIITSAGNPTPWGEAIKESGALWFHVAPSVYHALKAQSAGADVVVASGREGGGHVAFEPIHTMVLLPAVVRAVDIPVVGAGGFCDGASLVAALALGAIGVQMGTRFIATRESDFHDLWKNKVVQSSEMDTLVGISIFGPARYLKNEVAVKLHELLKGGFEQGYNEGVMLETRGIALSIEGGDPEWSIYFGGEVAGRIDGIPTVAELLEGIEADAERIITSLQGMRRQR
ncbi:MAG: nitronate monooxygenase [Actinomycetota bacterium]|nr:nitronate monooxygenase [Actinomycetota bacterium]